VRIKWIPAVWLMVMLIPGQGCPTDDLWTEPSDSTDQNPSSGPVDASDPLDTSGPSEPAATHCKTTDLAGTWRLTNQSTWNEITMDEKG
jgi:hypothetical protein